MMDSLPPQELSTASDQIITDGSRITGVEVMAKENRDNHLWRAAIFRLRGWANRLDLSLLDRRLRRQGLGNVSSIKTWMTNQELKQLYELASSCPLGAVGLEVGSYLGASSCYLAAALAAREGRLICVDTWQNDAIAGEQQRDTLAEFEANVAAVRSHITTIRKRSEDLLAAEVGHELHLVFLDGDHSYAAVSHEMRFFTPLITDDGYLIFHDAVAMEGVARTIGEALASGEWKLEGLVHNLLWLRKTKWTTPVYRPPTYA